MLSFHVSRSPVSYPGPSAAESAFAGAAAMQIFPDFRAMVRRSGRWYLAADIFAAVLAFPAAAFLARALSPAGDHGQFRHVLSSVSVRQFMVFAFLGLASILWFDSRGHYRQRLPYWESVGHIAGLAAAGFVASGFLEFALGNHGSRLWVAFGWVLFGVVTLMARGVVRHRLEKTGAWRIPAVMIGNGPAAEAAQRALDADAAMGFSVVKRLPPSILADMTETHAWKQMLMLHDARHIFLALEGGEIERYQAALKSLPRARVPCSIVPPWQGLPSSTLTPHHFVMRDVMMLHDTNRLTLPLPRLVKRVVDIALAGTALAVFALPMVLVGLIVRCGGGSALFTQMRVGRHGRLFRCYKFRSMRPDAEKILRHYLDGNPGAAEEWRRFQKLKHDVRVTKVGALIRRFSIDELPQLINVLRGDMSLVGPRPCLPGQEKLYADDFSFYESVRPGITGPWQVGGRNSLTFRERVALEAWYGRNWNLWLDIVIILKTFPVLLERGKAF
ncbi:MAG: exopolysaccharide biosynthesis polyprenyl glycosylphosphotransferase [Alphaproteobacteria bacterium]|nr:exopolysaccharide biosynthesis polyprenyl glycosylphosphotransferase [Alphaproteobacteria bacterium]